MMMMMFVYYPFNVLVHIDAYVYYDLVDVSQFAARKDGASSGYHPHQSPAAYRDLYAAPHGQLRPVSLSSAEHEQAVAPCE